MPPHFLDRVLNDTFNEQHIDPHLSMVKSYWSNVHVLDEAKELVPISELIQDNLCILDDESNYQDNLLPLVVEWFKSDFFSWFEEPKCEKCSLELSYKDTHYNIEQKQVEVYECPKGDCDHKFEFIRHCDPAILLQTRKGRCGEWANCFAIILLSLNYPVRIVYDTTDHVWVEVWSEPKQRWIHVDPCEGTIDTPLIYEAGWGKKLEYCIAIGQWEAQDVTGRYVLDFSATKGRRKGCAEEWLAQYLRQTTERLLRSAPSDEIRRQVRSRQTIDLAYLRELTSKPQVAPDRSQLQGRKTGGMQWRLERGEYRVAEQSKTTVKIEPPGSSGTTCKAIFSLTYDCDRNLYECSMGQYDNMKGWNSLVYEYRNIDHKYERDWKTSYLSRYESCPAAQDGTIKWRLDLSQLEQWHKIELIVRGKVYPNTSIRVSLSCFTSINCDDTPSNVTEVRLNELMVIDRPNDVDIKMVELLAILSGGAEHDHVAWQKPQLFRQTRNQDNNHEAQLLLRIL